MTSYIQVGIGDTFPINLLCLSDGAIAFVVVQKFKGIYDGGAYFDTSGFRIKESEFSYNVPYEYKEIPELLEWLQRQNLINPFGNKDDQ